MRFPVDRPAARLRGAIIGAGNVAVHGHAPAWLRREDVAIVAAADMRPERRSVLKTLLPGIAWHDSPARLLDSEELDFVDVCTPPAAHAPVIRLALERGLHVLCEKPLVLDPEEMEELTALASEKGRVLATVHNWRHAPALKRAGELIRSGAIGEVRRCRWEVIRNRPASAVADGDGAAMNWRVDPMLSGGGILTDHGWHAVYVLAWWLGESPVRVRAVLTAASEQSGTVEDTADALLEFASARAEVFLTWAGEERRNSVKIEGTRGNLTIDGRFLELGSTDGRSERLEFAQALSEGSHHPDWFGGVANEFLAEVAHPAERGRSLAEALVCLAVIQAARASDREGGVWVPVSRRRSITVAGPTRTAEGSL